MCNLALDGREGEEDSKTRLAAERTSRQQTSASSEKEIFTKLLTLTCQLDALKSSSLPFFPLSLSTLKKPENKLTWNKQKKKGQDQSDSQRFK